MGRYRFLGGLDTPNRAVSFRHDSWGRKPPTELMPGGCTGASSPSVAPAHTRVPQFDFLPFQAEMDRTRTICFRHLVTRRCLRLITARSRSPQLMSRAGQTNFVAGVSSLPLKRDSEPNHAIIVTCATHLAAMRHNERDNPPRFRRPPEGNQDHKLLGRVTSDFGPQNRLNHRHYRNVLLARPFQLMSE
jgi:hypothetical protein